VTLFDPSWLLPKTVELLHEEQIAEHGGDSGIRSRALLESSLAAPAQMHHYGDSDLFDLAACYGYRIARNHPFVDGNKRTAWICSRLFLRLHGCDIAASDHDKVETMLQVASGTITEAEFASWLRQHAV